MKKTLAQLIPYYILGGKKREEQQKAEEKALHTRLLQEKQERRHQEWLKQVAMDTTPEKLQETGTAAIIDLINDANFCYMKGDTSMTFRKVFLGDTSQQIVYYIDMEAGTAFSVQNDNTLQHCFTIPKTQYKVVRDALYAKRDRIKTQRAYYNFISYLPKRGIVNQK